MKPRGSPRRLKQEGLCWHCKTKTFYVFDWIDGSETWECPVCIYKYGRVARFKRFYYNFMRELRQKIKLNGEMQQTL